MSHFDLRKWSQQYTVAGKENNDGSYNTRNALTLKGSQHITPFYSPINGHLTSQKTPTSPLSKRDPNVISPSKGFAFPHHLIPMTRKSPSPKLSPEGEQSKDSPDKKRPKYDSSSVQINFLVFLIIFAA
jgi:hypothetical protein